MPEPVGGSGISGGAIAGIVIGVVVLFAILGIAFYCQRGGKMPDFPSMPSPPSFIQKNNSNSAGTSNPNVSSVDSAGFENPVMSLGKVSFPYD